MFNTFGFRNLGRESCSGRRVAAYRFKAKGHVTVSVCDVPCYTLLTVIIRPRESYIVAHPKIFVYGKLEVAKQILERSLGPFSVASKSELLKRVIRPIGDCKIHVSTSEIILTFGGMISL